MLSDWLAAHGAAGWTELFSVLRAAPPDDITPARRRLMRQVDLSDAPAGVLRDIVTDRILGAWAERALHERGLPVPAAEVPASARAVLLAGELAEMNRAAMLTYRMTAEHPDQDPGLLPDLRAAVGQAVADWRVPGRQVTPKAKKRTPMRPIPAVRSPQDAYAMSSAGLVYTMV